MGSFVFVTKNSNNFYTLEPGKTLLHFIEYDFTYFWEQSIALGKQSRRDGSCSAKDFFMVRNLILKCHPYFEAQANSDFENIVLDCIIEYICSGEKLSREELWNRCLVPKNKYERALFGRISEYKTGRAINQWENLMRMQEYAKTKLSYIFDGDLTSKSIYETRKNYFDLRFSVISKELGYPSGEMPSARRYAPSQMPNAPFAISKVSKVILKHVSELIDSADTAQKPLISPCCRDKLAMDAFGYMKQIPRPEELEVKTAAETFDKLAQEVYMPDSFKAVIDLEFDKMFEDNVIFRHCERCGKYFYLENDYRGAYCNRVNASGRTCREIAETESPKRANVITDALDARCNSVYDSLLRKIGDGFSEGEFREWAQYLANMRENVEKKLADESDLDSFLDYSEKMVREPPKSRLTATTPVQQASVPVKYKFPTLAELEEKDGGNRR